MEWEVRALEPIRVPRQLSHRDAADSRVLFPRQETQRAGGSTASPLCIWLGGARFDSETRVGERVDVCVLCVCCRS